MLFQLLGLFTILSTSISIKTDIKRFNNDINVDEKVIYVDISLNESLKDNNPYIHYINGEDDNNINLILDINDIYHSELPLSLDILNNENSYFEICCDDEYVTEHISISLLKENNYNYVCISNDEAIKGYGYYGDKLANPGATYRTQRVWLNNTNEWFYHNDDWGTPCKNVVGYYCNNSWNMIEMPSIVNVYNNIEYYYADIPFNVSNVHFMRLSGNENHNYLIYQDSYINQLTYGTCYFTGNSSYEEYLNVHAGVVDGANAPLLSLVVEAYLTYGKNNSNGCTETTVKNLFFTWFKNKSASKSDLKDFKLLDYTGYTSNGNSYEGLEKNASFSINEKWNTMCSQAGVDPNTGKKRTFTLSFLKSDMGKVVFFLGVSLVIGIVLYLSFRTYRKRMIESKYTRRIVFRFIKRMFDICFSILMILICSIFLWWWILLINLFVTKGHPFFAPKRVGRKKKVFRMFKFRSMRVDAPVIPPYEMSQKERESYETGFGKFLRKTSLDETLQFINVLIGQMSIVGPRPGAAEDEDVLIEARDSFKPSAFMVRPGITGYSQVYMKRQHDVMSKAWFDSEYVKKMSFIIDLKIIVHTFLFIFKGK